MQRSRIYLAAGIIALACLVAISLIMKWPHSAIEAIGGKPATEPDKRVPWFEPPGKFEPAGDRIKPADVNIMPGGLADSSNRAVHFVGLSLAKSPEWSMEGPLPPFDAWRKQGINLIRVPVRWQDIEPAPMQVSVDAILGIRRFITAASAAGLGVILQNTTPLSADTECPGIPDAPVWAFRKVPDSFGVACAKDTPLSVHDTEAVKRFQADFIDAAWTPDNLTLQDHLIRAWTKLAEVAAGSMAVIGYGITESLECPADMPEAKCTAQWTGYTDRFVNHLRAVDSPALFFLSGSRAPAPEAGDTATLIELVPRKALDFAPELPIAVPSGVFLCRRIPVADDADWQKAISVIESRGRSFLVDYADGTTRDNLATTPTIPHTRMLTRPWPVAIAGRSPSFRFDSSTDVFTMSFEDGEVRPGELPETMVYLPVGSMYRDDPAADAPRFTIDISDGTAGLMAGKTDVLLWQTVVGAGTHTMKIAPWGGTRLTDDHETDRRAGGHTE